MERLTIRNSDGTYSQPTHTTFEKMFYKLAELEDVLEKYGIESVEELDSFLASHMCIQNTETDLEALCRFLQDDKQNCVVIKKYIANESVVKKILEQAEKELEE